MKQQGQDRRPPTERKGVRPNGAFRRKFPLGAEVHPEGGTDFRVWAPRHKKVALELKHRPDDVYATLDMQQEAEGYFRLHAPDAEPGMFYKFRLKSASFADPGSRFQPEGPHGPSQIIDAADFTWSDLEWRGIERAGQVLYEMHVGTFTPEGTWEAAAGQLPELVNLGITVLELMPVADFPGGFGWGYDGVNLFAPSRLYGTPDAFRAFVNEAHRLGLGVILDVVYNHIGPDGNHLKEFAADYFTDRHQNEWGQAINFDGENSGPVREFFVANAQYWIQEFHLDGLRLDATQQMFDSSRDNIQAAITRAVRQGGAGRNTYIVAENEPQETRLVRSPTEGGYGMDALWNDDFHHTAKVALTGHTEAYYTDYRGTPQEFISAAKHGYLYQGQWYSWQKKRRGTRTSGLRPSQFVTYLQNHDQIANSLRGLRAHQLAAPGTVRALTALLLLGPATPMLFQGQEFHASAPFLYFANHKPELATLVTRGRREFLRQFPSLASPESNRFPAEPGSPETFRRCKLDFSERDRHREAHELHRDLLKLRREDPVFSRLDSGDVDGAILAAEAFVLQFRVEGRPNSAGSSSGTAAIPDSDERLLLINLGTDLKLSPAPEPLLAPPCGRDWQVLWSSESPEYGGCGIPAFRSDETWVLPGRSALVLMPGVPIEGTQSA